MSDKSNNHGRAYEYACLIALYDEIKKYNEVKIVQNSSPLSSIKSWETLNPSEKLMYKISANAGANTILELEPLILDDKNDLVQLQIQKDSKGEIGDERDILISRNSIQWEIGLSIKHNHFAVKHSRLSDKIDFGEKWYKVPCSQSYWDDVTPVFNFLKSEKNKGTKWRNIEFKEDRVYFPILKAFKSEIEKQYSQYKINIPKLMVEYLLGNFDFYKVIGIDKSKSTRIQGYNLRGHLNINGVNRKANIKIPISALPTRIISLNFKPNSKNILELYLDGGWQFSFRLHNAESNVVPSLKFDIQIIGMPATIISIDTSWNQ